MQQLLTYPKKTPLTGDGHPCINFYNFVTPLKINGVNQLSLTVMFRLLSEYLHFKAEAKGQP
jgi:hypothetical protein